MEKIRVLVADRPRLMRDLVLATISDQPDMEVVARVAGDGDIMNATAAYRPDVVIIFAENLDERPGICTDVLASHPQVKILALVPEHNLGAFYWRETEVDIRSMAVESSEQGMLGALRGKVRCT